MAVLWTDIINPAELTGYARASLNDYEAKKGTLARWLPNKEVGDNVARFRKGNAGFVEVARQLGVTPLPDELMLRAKNVMAGDYYRDRQSLKARSSEAANALARGWPLDRERQQVEAAQQVSAETLKELAGKYLLPEKAYIYRVKP